MIGLVTGAADRAVAGVHALDRALEATSAALRLLRAADGVDWAGPGAAAFRDRLAALVGDVQQAEARLRAAHAAAVDHARAVRSAGLRSEAALAAGPPSGFASPVVVPAPPDRWGTGRAGTG